MLGAGEQERDLEADVCRDHALLRAVVGTGRRTRSRRRSAASARSAAPSRRRARPALEARPRVAAACPIHDHLDIRVRGEQSGTLVCSQRTRGPVSPSGRANTRSPNRSPPARSASSDEAAGRPPASNRSLVILRVMALSSRTTERGGRAPSIDTERTVSYADAVSITVERCGQHHVKPSGGSHASDRRAAGPRSAAEQRDARRAGRSSAAPSDDSHPPVRGDGLSAPSQHRRPG